MVGRRGTRKVISRSGGNTVIEIDRGLNEIMGSLGDLDRTFVKVGIQSDAGNDREGNSILDIAIKNEFGDDTTPSRPFMRYTFDRRQNDIAKVIERKYGQVLDLKIDANTALNQIGSEYTNFVTNTFTNNNFEPNAPSTIRQKGSSMPLIDTGQMRQSVTWKIDE